MNKIKKNVVITAIAIFALCLSCIRRNNNPIEKVQMTSNSNFSHVQSEITCNKDDVPIKDGIDLLIEERACQSFNSTIFAHLNFGDNRQKVEETMKSDKYMTIQVPVGEKVSSVRIRSYDAEYYNDKLALLTLYAEENELYNSLGVIYTTKYGKTKNNKWNFADCSIEITTKARREHDTSLEAGYGRLSGPILYYNSFRGERCQSITKDGSFLVITYKNHYLIKQIERQKYITDSINKVESLRKIEQEKELAKKLSTEIATGI